MTIIALIIILAVAQLMVFSGLTGWVRTKHNVWAPATTGHETFERYFRVQQNTMEHVVAFVPAIYLCAVYASFALAIICGVLYLIGRCLYAYTYISDPKKRAPGMILSFMPTALMTLAALVGILWSLLA